MIELSIITPNFNDGGLLAERLSFLAPLFPENWEYIIVDDASTDNSLSLITPFIPLYKNLHIFPNDKNQGPTFSANRGVEKAKGKYVLAISANDILLPNWIDTMRAHIGKTDAGVITTNPSVCHEDFALDRSSSFTELFFLEGQKEPLFLPGTSLARLIKVTSLWIAGHSSLIRRDLLLKYGGYDEALKLHCDWYINYIVAFDAGLYYIPVTCALFRTQKNGYHARFQKKDLKKISCYLLSKLRKEQEPGKSRFIYSAAYSLYIRRILKSTLIYPRYWRFFMHAFFRHFSLKNPLKKEKMLRKLGIAP